MLKIDNESGSIASLTDGKVEYIACRMPIFKIAFRDENGKQSFADASQMRLASCFTDERSIKLGYEGECCNVEVRAEVTDEISWYISVFPCSTLTVEWVNFPQIAVPDQLGKDKYKILWGFNEGVLVDDINEREKLFGYIEPQYPSKGVMGLYPAIVETQFMAYLDGSTGMYLGAHDASDSLKGVDFYKLSGGEILLQLRHYCGCCEGEAYTMPYPVVTRFFEGGWESAADIYREWFEENKRGMFVPISENRNLPKWYGESPVVVTYPVRGTHDMDKMLPNAMFPYINAMKHVERLEKELDSKIMVLLMHWEGTAPWAPPCVWPPFGGEDELKKFIDELHKSGDVLGVYCSGIGWTLKSNVDTYSTEERFEKENLRNEMCLSPEQELPYSNICTAQRVGYDLCPTRQFTVNTVNAEVEKMVAAGIDYIQLLDQNHGGTPYFCYSKQHGHPPVPGKWQVDAMKTLLSGVNKIGKNVLFGCESAAAEAYAPYLLFSDNRFELNYATGVQVPVYAYLFHEYLNNFMGNQVCVADIFDLDASPDNICERLAYSFSAGDMLTLVLDQYGEIAWCWGQLKTTTHPDQQTVKTLVRNLNQWRRGYGKKYLHVGKMTKSLNIACGENIFKRNGSFSDMKRSKLHTSAWLSQDGYFGQFIVNYNTSAQECKFVLDEDGYKLMLQDGTVMELCGGENTLEIPALSAVLIEKSL